MKTRDLISSGRTQAGALRVCGIVSLALGAWVAAPGASEAPAPEISLSLRGVAQNILVQGEPLRVAVLIEAPDDATGSIELAPASGTWADAVTVELAAPASSGVLARALVVGRPDSARATLDRDQVAGGVWRISPDATAGIAPGDYVVRVRIAIPAGAGWTGEAISEDLAIQVTAISSDPVRVSQRATGLAADALAAGELEEAARLLDAELERAPDQVALLTLRATVAHRAGNNLAALACLNRISRLASPEAREPSIELLELRDRVTDVLLGPAAEGAAEVNPPAWSWPPRAVMIPPARKSGATSAAAASVAAAPAVASATPPASQVVGAPVPAPASTPSPGAVVPGAELAEAKIVSDPDGQWAASAKAGSEYGSPNYGAAKMTGAPDVPVGGDSVNAWCHHSSSKSLDWVELAYAKPVHATEVRVRQNYNPGAIVRVEALEADGTSHLWWEGIDPARPPGALNEIVWFAVRVPQTGYLVARIRLTLDVGAVLSWQEIDAVQLVGTPP